MSENVEYIPGLNSLRLRNGFTEQAEFMFTKLKKPDVVIDDGNWEDLSFLITHKNNFDHLSIRTEQVNWETIAELDNLRSLYIDGWFKAPLDFSKFKNLIWIEFYWSEDYHEESLFNLQNLEYLDIKGWKAGDCTKLSNLKKLRFLELVNCRKLKSLEGLQNLPLHKATFSGCSLLENCDPIGDVDTLKLIGFKACKRIQSYDFIKRMTGLHSLGLINCAEIETLSFLENLNQLEQILFTDTPVCDGDLGFLFRMPQLREVFFRNKRNFSHKPDVVKKCLAQKWGGQQYVSKIENPRKTLLGLEF